MTRSVEDILFLYHCVQNPWVREIVRYRPGACRTDLSIRITHGEPVFEPASPDGNWWTVTFDVQPTYEVVSDIEKADSLYRLPTLSNLVSLEREPDAQENPTTSCASDNPQPLPAVRHTHTDRNSRADKSRRGSSGYPMTLAPARESARERLTSTRGSGHRKGKGRGRGR